MSHQEARPSWRTASRFRQNHIEAQCPWSRKPYRICSQSFSPSIAFLSMQYWHMPESLICVTRGETTQCLQTNGMLFQPPHKATKCLWDSTKPNYLPGQCKMFEPDHDGQPFSRHRQVSRTLHCPWSRCAKQPVPGMPSRLVSHSEDRPECRQLHLSSSKDVWTVDTTPQGCCLLSCPSLDQKVTLQGEYEAVGCVNSFGARSALLGSNHIFEVCCPSATAQPKIL